MKGKAEVRLEVSLSGERFRLRAEEAVHPRLLEAAEAVNTRLDELREGGSGLTPLRMALMAAFQFAYQLGELDLESGLDGEQRNSLTQRIEKLIARIDEGLREVDS